MNNIQQLVENFGNFKILDNVTPSDSKVFGFACVSENLDRDIREWNYEVGSFDFIYGYYRASLLAYEHEKIACMAMFVMDDQNSKLGDIETVGIIFSLWLTQEESHGTFYSSQRDAKVVMRDLILMNGFIDATDILGKCDFNDR